MKSTKLFILLCLMSVSVYAQQQAQVKAQVQSGQQHQAKEQTNQQGASQTGQVANNLRQDASSVAQDMRSMVNSTKAVSEEAQDNARSDLVPLPPPPPPDVPEKSANPDDVCGSVGRRVSVGGCTDL
jgi:ectoine hydroxylase-related dioxygenase (phytanoyl-CoA dioxygenase family)